MAKAALYNLDSVADAQTCGIRHIGIGTCSSGKLRDYLRKQGFSDSVISEAVAELIKREYIDDVKAGRKVLLYRSGKKQESRLLLKQRLYAAGVRGEIADELISEVEEDGVLCFNLYLSVKPETADAEEAYAMEEELLKTASKRGFGSETARYAYGKWLEKVINDR
ncbi:MAG: RecX family transcriptional regulator [Clostridiales bacterium]|nr:RecX family transcriptional regulator [Clostridiales bacterium]